MTQLASPFQAERRQADVLGCIVESIRRTGRPPTVREIADRARISSTSVVDYHLNRLVREGKIRRDMNVARGVWPLIGGDCCPFCGGTGKWTVDA